MSGTTAMKIDIDEFKKALEYMQSINQSSLEELSVYYPDTNETHRIPDGIINEWKYIGLNNTELLATILEDKSLLSKESNYFGR
jgi:hypothetical protein